MRGILIRVGKQSATREGKIVKAIRVHEFGGPEVLKVEDVPDRRAGPGKSSCG